MDLVDFEEQHWGLSVGGGKSIDKEEIDDPGMEVGNNVPGLGYFHGFNIFPFMLIKTSHNELKYNTMTAFFMKMKIPENQSK